jgi:hypothetical protein
MDYGVFLAPFASAVSFLTALHAEFLDVEIVKALFPRVFDLFPLEASRLLSRHWDRVDAAAQAALLRAAFPTLFMSVPGAADEPLLAGCRKTLTRIALWGVRRGEP